MARQVYLLDLSDLALAKEYEDWHKPGNVPAQVVADIEATGITILEIYRSGDRLVMVTESSGDTPAGDRLRSEESHEWEARMDRFQKPVGWAEDGAKWQPARRIFDLKEHTRK